VLILWLGRLQWKEKSASPVAHPPTDTHRAFCRAPRTFASLVLSLLLAVGVLVVTPAIAHGDVVAGYDLTTCMAKVLHLSPGVMNTYPLPSCGSDFWATMTDSQIAWRSNSTWTVNDYVAGTPGRLLSGRQATVRLTCWHLSHHRRSAVGRRLHGLRLRAKHHGGTAGHPARQPGNRSPHA